MIDGLIEKKTNLSRNALIYTELKKKKRGCAINENFQENAQVRRQFQCLCPGPRACVMRSEEELKVRGTSLSLLSLTSHVTRNFKNYITPIYIGTQRSNNV